MNQEYNFFILHFGNSIFQDIGLLLKDVQPIICYTPLKLGRSHVCYTLYIRVCIYTYKYRTIRTTCDIFARSRDTRSTKRSVGRLPLQRLETSLPSCNDALLDFHSISSGIRSTFHPRREQTGLFLQPASSRTPYPSSRQKKIEFQLDPRGEQLRFVRVNPFTTKRSTMVKDNRSQEQRLDDALREEKREKENIRER